MQLDQQSRVAAAGVEVMRRLDSPRAVCDCIAALVSGDLAAAALPDAAHSSGAAEHLLPLLPPASASPDLVSLPSHLGITPCVLVLLGLCHLKQIETRHWTHARN